MGYVQTVLQQPGETVTYETKISWMTYLPGILILLAAIAVYVVLRGVIRPVSWPANAAGLTLLAVSLFILGRAWFERWTTEIAITNRRIILKRGFIRRDTAEMHMDKVESVDVNQSFFGRLLDYGDVTVRGTGAGLETLHLIDAPIAFRNHVKTHEHAPGSQ
jgi:uncharacterized membrane protein YdbT with pleckstrin-like domain